MEATQTVPNLFELAGHGTKVIYSTTSVTGQPQLSYRNANFEKTFTGQEIRAQGTEIGQLLTVTLQPSVDARFVLFTLLLPSVELDKQDPNKEREFRTQGIVTTVNPGIDTVLVDGLHETYQFVALHGTAKFVEF